MLKSFTDIRLTVLSSRLKSSSSLSSSIGSSNELLIFSPSSGSTNFTKYVLANPINTAIIDVNANTHTIVIIILPNLFGVFIFAIDVVIVKNISGMIITNKKFKNKSPKGLRIVAFSLNTIPTIAPTIIATNNIIVDL